MRKIKLVNVIILFFIAFFRIAYGAGPYDEIIPFLKERKEDLSFTYGKYVQGTISEKIKACESLGLIGEAIIKQLDTIALKEPNSALAIAKKNVQDHIESFKIKKSSLNIECKNSAGSENLKTLFASYVGTDDTNVKGLRFLLKGLIDQLEKNNKEELIASNTDE